MHLITTTLSPQPIRIISLTRISLFPAPTTAYLLPRRDASPTLAACSPGLVVSTTNTNELEATSYELRPRRGAACCNPGSCHCWRWRSQELQPATADAGARCVSGGVESTCYNRHDFEQEPTFPLAGTDEFFCCGQRRRVNFIGIGSFFLEPPIFFASTRQRRGHFLLQPSDAETIFYWNCLFFATTGSIFDTNRGWRAR